MKRNPYVHPLFNLSDEERLAWPLVEDLLALPEGTPTRQRQDALLTAAHALAHKLGNQHTLDKLTELCKAFRLIIESAGLPGNPAAARGVSIGNKPAIAVYELEQYTLPPGGNTLGHHIAYLIAGLISPTEYTLITIEQDSYGTWLTLHPTV